MAAVNRSEHIPEGLTLIFEGKQRSGKTLSLTIWALAAHQQGRNIFSNYKLGFPHKPLDFADARLSDDEESPFWNSFIALDEWNFLFDGRRSMKQDNIEHSAFLLQQKKQGCTLGGTTHDLMSLDKRLRDNYDYLIRPRVHPEYPKKPEILRVVVESGPLQRMSRRTLTLDCRPFLNLYNTRATYNPFKNAGKPKPRVVLQ